jgi:hypothetical protein
LKVLVLKNAKSRSVFNRLCLLTIVKRSAFIFSSA